MNAKGLIIALFGILLLYIGTMFIAEAINRQLEQPQGIALPTAQKINETKLEQLVNDYRVSKGLQPLIHDERLCKAAQDKLEDMITKRYWNHTSPTGKDFWWFIKPYFEDYKNAGENLAIGNEGEAVAYSGWINSPSHLENIVGNYTHSCVQSAFYGDYGGNTQLSVAVHHFAK